MLVVSLFCLVNIFVWGWQSEAIQPETAVYPGITPQFTIQWEAWKVAVQGTSKGLSNFISVEGLYQAFKEHSFHLVSQFQKRKQTRRLKNSSTSQATRNAR